MKIDIEQLEQLALSPPPGIDFFEHFIQSLVQQLHAEAGVLWNRGQNSYRPIAQFTINESESIRISQEEHSELLERANSSRKSLVVQLGDDENLESSQSLVVTPAENSDYVIELLFRSKQIASREPQLLNELLSASRLLKRQIQSSPVKSVDNTPALFSVADLSVYLNALHSSIDRTQTCLNIANETRRVLDCDRVSVVIHHRGKFRIGAISGQPSVNRRSNTVSLLQKLAQQTLGAGLNFWFPSETELPPQIQSPLNEYISISATRSLVILPILNKHSEIVADPEADSPPREKIVGGVIFEHCNSQWDRAEIGPALNLIMQHAGNAFRNASRHQQLFLYPLWNWLGKSKVLTSSRILPKSILFVAALLISALVLGLWQTPFYVSAKGRLIPKHSQLIFPRTAGDVVSVEVEQGDQVRENEPLVILRNRDLELRVEDVTGRLESLAARKSAIERGRDLGIDRTQQEAQKQNLKSIQTEIESLTEQLKQLLEMQRGLVIVSPLDGEVISWDVTQKLKGRSVTPQNQLLEIAQVDGPWQLELDIEDRRVGHLLRGLESSQNGRLKVRFTLAVDPTKNFEGEISEVSNTIFLNAENEQIVRVKVDIDEAALSLKQAKTGVIAKIYTGQQTSIGYLWLHDIPEAWQRYILFYFTN